MPHKSPADVLADIDALKHERPITMGAPVEPQDPTETNLVAIWADVLHLDRIGVTDNFFYLGGDSIHVTQVASRVRDVFGIEFDIVRFFEDPTIAGIGEAIRQELGSAPLVSHCLEHLPSQTPAKEHPYHDWKVSKELPAEEISCLAIPTRDRPDSLNRCLRSYLANLRRYGRDCRIVIADDSTVESSRRQNFELVQSLARSSSIPLQYFGEAERNAYAAEFTHIGISPETIHFAIRGHLQNGVSGGAGAPRNFLQLIAADEAFASVDDDTECAFARPAEFAVHIEEKDDYSDPAAMIVYTSRENLLRSVPLVELDFLSAHEQLLNRNFGIPEAQVLVTLFGIVGDCGWGSPSRYFHYQNQLSASSADWSTVITKRDMLRATHSYSVTAGAEMLMTTAYAVSGQTILPPFSPVGRGSDLVFGKLLKLLHPSALFGHLPWGVLHSPVSPRSFWPGEQFRSAGTSDISTMLMALLAKVPDATDAMGALKTIAAELKQLSHISNTEFALLLSERTNSVIETQLGHIEEIAENVRSSMPSYAADADQYVQRARERFMKPYVGTPLEFLQEGNAEGALTTSRRYIGLFGDLLEVWPEMVHVARQLKSY